MSSAPFSSLAEYAPAGAALKSLYFLREQMRAALADLDFTAIDPSYRDSAANLIAYLALRRHDVRLLQRQLNALGLSSLGHCESDALDTVTRVIAVLEQMHASFGAAPEASEPWPAPAQEYALQGHAEALFAGQARGRDVRIMVTMPEEAAHDAQLVERLVVAGMNCQRINCAHDGPDAWAKMIEHVRQASRKLGKPCQVAMDLPGPKLRTGPMAAGPAILKLRPQRDENGAVLQPARAYLTGDRHTAEVAVEVPAKWLRTLQVGDVLKCRDARGAKRKLHVVDVQPQGVWVELDKTTYIAPNMALKRKAPDGRKAKARVVSVPPRGQAIKLREGDLLTLTRAAEQGAPAQVDPSGTVVAPAHIGCTAEAVFATAKPGDPIWFDDGKIGGKVLEVSAQALQVRIDHAPGGAKLKADKGINLPNTDLGLVGLADDDLAALEFAARHADIIELSFVNSADDVRCLFDHLKRLDAEHLGVVLKIETRQGFENLPQLLLEGMRSRRLGVMIARGDLAVETGFERTAELQEEMLCLCEAAHVPVIWATQVLETLAKTGAPTRAEMTDAAMGIRAECVMLNKGPYIHKAIAALDDLLKRMHNHHEKKRDMLRKLQVARLPVQTAQA
ncbi:pyruvate kinase [Pseudomonas sp. RIT-PI-S]|uniref:pyruvate kinase n=1 Tax=Pseudomonas sp. RIT-PI-S TaxID=3035295 RepID=UPI0021D9A771|nr:pyruvate kinase [Pseudomonas sp. RIT-PI-S]